MTIAPTAQTCRGPDCSSVVPRDSGRRLYCSEACSYQARLVKQRAGYQEGQSYRGRAYSYDRNLRLRYNLTLAEYEQMFAEHEGKCAVCGQASSGRRLHVDHDHVTGRVRGLLCGSCNAGIGGARDDIAILQAMIDYLTRHRA